MFSSKIFKTILAVLMVASCVFFTACGSKSNSNNSSADPAASDEYINDSNETEDEDIDEEEPESEPLLSISKRHSDKALTITELRNICQKVNIELKDENDIGGDTRWLNYKAAVSYNSNVSSLSLLLVEYDDQDSLKEMVRRKKLAWVESIPDYVVSSKTTDKLDYFFTVTDNDAVYFVQCGNTILMIGTDPEEKNLLLTIVEKLGYQSTF